MCSSDGRGPATKCSVLRTCRGRELRTHIGGGEVVGAQAHKGGEGQNRTRGECGISITSLVQ